jgi:hypothetical protein
LWLLPVIVVAVAGLGLVSRSMSQPATVHRLSIVNDTPYALDVEVTGASRDGWTGLATAERERTTDVSDVVDQGQTWIFRVGSQGVDGGEVTVSRDDLARSDWKVVIPASVGTRLAAEGAPPTPPPDF